MSDATIDDIIDSARRGWEKKHPDSEDGFPRYLMQRLNAAGWSIAEQKHLEGIQSKNILYQIANLLASTGYYPNKTAIPALESIKSQAQVLVETGSWAIEPGGLMPHKEIPKPPKMNHRMQTLLFGHQDPPKYPTYQARTIVEVVLPRVIGRFLQKNSDYGENAQELGLKGQFADIWRKVGKLRAAWWEGKELKSEPATEVAEDLIAHLLLALYFADPEVDDWEDD